MGIFDKIGTSSTGVGGKYFEAGTTSKVEILSAKVGENRHGVGNFIVESLVKECNNHELHQPGTVATLCISMGDPTMGLQNIKRFMSEVFPGMALTAINAAFCEWVAAIGTTLDPDIMSRLPATLQAQIKAGELPQTQPLRGKLCVVQAFKKDPAKTWTTVVFASDKGDTVIAVQHGRGPSVATAPEANPVVEVPDYGDPARQILAKGFPGTAPTGWTKHPSDL